MAREDITAEKAEVDDGPNNGEEITRRNSSLWRKVCDMEEAKNQLLFSLPMILTNLSYYAITLVSVMVAGHLGQTSACRSHICQLLGLRYGIFPHGKLS